MTRESGKPRRMDTQVMRCQTNHDHREDRFQGVFLPGEQIAFQLAFAAISFRLAALQRRKSACQTAKRNGTLSRETAA